jgi:hypothetical protein
MSRQPDAPQVPLPRGWSQQVKSTVLHVIVLAQYAMSYTRGWAIDSPIRRLRLKAENDRLRQEVALLAEEIRIKDARMKRVEPQKRPHYVPTERMAILELRCASGKSHPSYSTRVTAVMAAVGGGYGRSPLRCWSAGAHVSLRRMHSSRRVELFRRPACTGDASRRGGGPR